MALLATLINEGLDLYAGRCTDVSNGLDEVCQRENVSRWLMRQHQAELEQFYLPLLNLEIAKRQGIRARATRPSANQIEAASIAQNKSQGSTSIPVSIQPVLFDGFATERYYVGPNLSKEGRHMTLREAMVARDKYADLVREHRAKFERLTGVIAVARQKGLQETDLLGKLWA